MLHLKQFREYLQDTAFWWIQDFSGAKTIIWQVFRQNYIKMKDIGPGALGTGSPLGSANEIF